MTVALCMFALWAWGGWISWKGIENGNGWIGAILSEKIRKSLNKKENWWKKALLSAAFGYVAMGAKVIEWILTFVMRMVDGQNEKYHATWILTAYGGDGSGVCNSSADGMREEKY